MPTLAELKKLEGQDVEYLFRDKYRRMNMAAVQTDENRIKGCYKGYVGEVRLNYTDGKPREWDGFWTNKLDRIRIL